MELRVWWSSRANLRMPYVVLATVLLVGCLTAEARDEPPAEPALTPAPSPSAPPTTGNSDEGAPRNNGTRLPRVVRAATGLLDVHVRQADLSAVLEMLSYEAQANIVASKSVSGQVSANLYGVTLEQALDAVLAPDRFVFHVVDNTIFVGTADELAALHPPPEARVFPLRYVTVPDAALAARAVVGEHGTVVESSGQQTGGGTATAAAGAPAPSAITDYLVVAATPHLLTEVARVLADIDRRPPQVLIEATILRATLTEQNQFGIDFNMLGGVDFENVGSVSNASADLATGRTPAPRLQDTTFNINTSFNATLPDGGFTFGLIKNNIASFIRALEEVTDVVVVANPKISALNKQEAEVIVGRRDGYITTIVTETIATQKVEFLETGTQIRFRPFINHDGTVRLTVHPKDSNGGLNPSNLPFEETTEARADLLVNDGNTVLIGGLFRERTVNSRQQLPVLGDIPFGGILFGNRNDQTVREEVIILLTVHVLKDTASEQAQFRALREDIERMRVGVRAGLLASGRERLAQAYLHEALAQLEHGDRPAALLNARMAIHNQPTLLPALKLRERLLDERQWDADGARMRTFILDLIAGTGTPGLPPSTAFDRPPEAQPAAPTVELGDAESEQQRN